MKRNIGLKRSGFGKKRKENTKTTSLKEAGKKSGTFGNSRGRLKRRSKKREAQEREYSKLRKQYLLENNSCAVGVEGCTGLATQVHHRKRRYGAYINKVEWFLGTCAHCHQYVEANGKESRQKGWIID